MPKRARSRTLRPEVADGSETTSSDVLTLPAADRLVDSAAIPRSRTLRPFLIYRMAYRGTGRWICFADCRFIVHFPFYAGDTKFYTELARNWLDHGVYGLFVQGQLLPVDMRMPGYPAFLAAIYALLGRTDKIVRIVQAFLDLATCVLTALIAARLAPASKRPLVAAAALWTALFFVRSPRTIRR